MSGSIMSCKPVPWNIWPGVHGFAAATTSACLLLFPAAYTFLCAFPSPFPLASCLPWALPSRPTAGSALPLASCGPSPPAPLPASCLHVRPQPHLTGIHTDSSRNPRGFRPENPHGFLRIPIESIRIPTDSVRVGGRFWTKKCLFSIVKICV